MQNASTTSAQPTKGYAPVNGLNMYYEVHGSGHPLVLIHGGGSTIQTSFGRILPLLAQEHRVVAVEMQAHGHTADIDRPLSFRQDADDIAVLLKHLGIQKTHVFGFSNGASTTLAFARQYPQLTGKIVVASAFYKKSGAQSWFWPMIKDASFDSMPQIYKDAFHAINPDEKALYRMYERDIARMQNFPEMTDEDIKAIQAPAFLIAGDRDIVSSRHLAEMQEMMNQARLAILPGAHGDFMGEASMPLNPMMVASVANMILDFLSSTDSGKSPK
jgi:pimeloyl-ACP methyl ester carboxylesterase